MTKNANAFDVLKYVHVKQWASKCAEMRLLSVWMLKLLRLTILIQWIDLNRSSVRKLQLKINKDNNSCFQHGSIQHLLQRNFCAYKKTHSFDGFLFDAFFYSHFVTLYERTRKKKHTIVEQWNFVPSKFSSSLKPSHQFVGIVLWTCSGCVSP